MDEQSKKRPSLWRRSRVFRGVTFGLIGCILFGCAFLGITNAIVIGTTSERIITAEEAAGQDADAILVLGALVYPDGRPSDILRDRLDNAIALYRAGAAPKIIMSGDHGTTSYDEVNGMKQYAMKQGVPEDDIFCDHAGFSTYESMHRAKNVFGAERIIVSTQTYHLYRALYDAVGLGLEATGVPADFHTFKEQLIWDLREAPARSKDVLMVLFQAPPTYGGDPIDLNGPASATDG